MVAGSVGPTIDADSSHLMTGAGMTVALARLASWKVEVARLAFVALPTVGLFLTQTLAVLVGAKIVEGPLVVAVAGTASLWPIKSIEPWSTGGLGTNSLIFRWLFTIKDRCEKCVLHKHNQSLRRDIPDCVLQLS